MVGLPDIVTRAKLGDDRFSHICMVGGQISGFPIDFGRRPVPECDTAPRKKYARTPIGNSSSL